MRFQFGWLLLIVSSIASAEPLEIGFAESELNPPIGMRLCGTFTEKLSTGTHDPLMVRSFVFRQGSIKFVIAGCDVAMMSPEVADAVRAEVASLGFREGHVLIHASETHNAPDHYGEFREAFHRDAIMAFGTDPAEPIDFGKLLIEALTGTIRRANEELAPAAVSFAESEVRNLAFNRRFYMKDGSIGWNPGKLNPDIERVAGPVDESLAVIAIHRSDEKAPVAIMTGFSLHLAILNDLNYGADFPFYIGQRLKEKISPKVFSHFLQAPCCEINHIDVSTKESQKGHEWAKSVGYEIADAAVESLDKAVRIGKPSLAVHSDIIDLQLQDYTPAQIEVAREIWFSPERARVPFLELVHAAKVAGIDEIFQGGPVAVRLQIFRLDSETVVVGLPSEVSVEIGLWIKEKSPFSNTFVLQNSNDWFGYVPTKRIFEQGHYEAEVAKIASGEAERMAEVVLKLLHEAKGRAR